jgi:hypothetical protein
MNGNTNYALDYSSHFINPLASWILIPYRRRSDSHYPGYRGSCRSHQARDRSRCLNSGSASKIQRWSLISHEPVGTELQYRLEVCATSATHDGHQQGSISILLVRHVIDGSGEDSTQTGWKPMLLLLPLTRTRSDGGRRSSEKEG